jgi:hypothetical protein
MQKFYWACLHYISIVADRPNSQDQIHQELKLAYGIETTAGMTTDERYAYLTFVFELVGYTFDLWFDSEMYKNERMSFVYL